jgi:hypothetical protein
MLAKVPMRKRRLFPKQVLYQTRPDVCLDKTRQIGTKTTKLQL